MPDDGVAPGRLSAQTATRGRISRRELIKRGGMAGMLAVLPAGVLDACGGGSHKGTTTSTVSAVPHHSSLTAQQLSTLQATLERLIPSDASGPGAKEAQVWRYIDRALAREEKAVAPLYTASLTALDAQAKHRHGKSFTALEPAQQDAILADVEADKAEGFQPGAAAFFAMLWEHTLEGMFGDPYHGGNQNFVGWKLIGFPGIRLYVSEQQQQLDVKVPLDSTSVAHYRHTFTTLDLED